MTEIHNPTMPDSQTSEARFSVLIVDDERLARTLLEEYVAKMPVLRWEGSCANAMQAMAVMQQKTIDILLTDIEMPELTGVEFVENLSYHPSIIFTTAYSQYAIDGYDLGVVDYLLKPFPFDRFVKAVNKAIERIQLIRAANTNMAMQQTQSQSQSQPDYMMVRADRRLYKVKYEDLLYVEGQQEYVTFHTKQRNITAFYSLKGLMEELPKDQFVRIHKSYIVSIRQVEIVGADSVTVAGVELPIGPSYRESAMRTLKN